MTEDRKRQLANERQKRYIEKNRAQINEAKRARYQETKAEITAEKRRRRIEEDGYVEREREVQKRYRDSRTEEQRERRKSRMSDWRTANAEALLEYARQYRENNREKTRAWDRERRARLLNVASEPYTEKDIVAAHGTCCHICKDEIDFSAPRLQGIEGWQLGLHLDHKVPISTGGSDLIENVFPAHAVCNLRKSVRLMVEDG